MGQPLRDFVGCRYSPYLSNDPKCLKNLQRVKTSNTLEKEQLEKSSIISIKMPFFGGEKLPKGMLAKSLKFLSRYIYKSKKSAISSNPSSELFQDHSLLNTHRLNKKASTTQPPNSQGSELISQTIFGKLGSAEIPALSHHLNLGLGLFSTWGDLVGRKKCCKSYEGPDGARLHSIWRLGNSNFHQLCSTSLTGYAQDLFLRQNHTSIGCRRPEANGLRISESTLETFCASLAGKLKSTKCPYTSRLEKKDQAKYSILLQSRNSFHKEWDVHIK